MIELKWVENSRD